MAKVCTNITEWIEDEISKPIEQWEEKRYEKCKKRSWWHPLRWLCWIVTRLVKVIRWIVVTIVTAVVTIVCHLIADVLGIILDVILGIFLSIAGLITWDKCTLQLGLAHLGNVVGGALILVGDILIRPIIQRVQRYRLSNYVEEQINEKFGSQSEEAEALKERFNVNYGAFGYRLTCRLYRMYVDSATESPTEPGVANLFALHRDGQINLYELAAFDRDCTIFSEKGWYRPRPYAIVSPFVPVGGQSVSRLSRDQLTEYIESAGVRGPHFRIFSISSWNLGMRERVASEKGRQLGLRIDFKREDKEVTDPQFINYNRSPINPVPVDCATKNKGQIDYFICELGRRPKSDFECCTFGQQSQMIEGSLNEALADLCSPVAVAVFGFTDKTTRGLASNLIGTTHCDNHNLPVRITSGVSFIDDIPDEMRKYNLIHELGHYYGLCHVDGFDRIMVSGKGDQGSIWTWEAIPNTLIHGGPRFVFREAQRVWDFILTNFPLTCFGIEDDIVL